MKLFDYQKNVIESCKQDPSHSQLISMPTGTGKTITFLHLAKELGKKTLVLVHRDELLNQTKEKATLCGFKEEDISVICAEKKGEIKLLTIAMVQSLNRNLDNYEKDSVEMIIVDEAHHATANSYLNIFSYFNIFEECKPIFGFTATPLRGDKDQLSKVFLSHSFKMTLSEATSLGYIVPVNGVRIEIDKCLKDIDQKQGDYDISQLDAIMNCDSINSLITEKCEHLNKTPGIIFCTSVNHAVEIAKKLREKKKKAVSVSYKTPKKTLTRIFQFLHQGKIQFITNAIKLSEGFDFPPIQSVILARPTRSPVLYKQMIGRGLRNSKNKKDCFVLEFTSNDPQMMKWEDIDSNATYQSYDNIKKTSEKEARKTYESLFKSPNVEILGVRISPFQFYECKIRRLVKYRNTYFYIPFEEGFCFYEIKNEKGKQSMNTGNYFYTYATMLFWKEKYSSFYVWDVGNYCMNSGIGPHTLHVCFAQMKYYGEVNDLGKWYPSEQQKVDRSQKVLMKKLGIFEGKHSSARKAEMAIEEKAIITAINKYLSKGLFSGVMTL